MLTIRRSIPNNEAGIIGINSLVVMLHTCRVEVQVHGGEKGRGECEDRIRRVA